MSGGMRPYGVGDLSPWPGDLAFTGPFLVEVKYDERVYAGGDRTWVGSTFLRKTLRELSKLALRHGGIIGRPKPVPVLFARSNLKPWRVFVRDRDFLPLHTGSGMLPRVETWVEITPEFFFEQFPARYDDARAEDVLAPQP